MYFEKMSHRLAALIYYYCETVVIRSDLIYLNGYDYYIYCLLLVCCITYGRMHL